jgi:hypothetical protein
LVPPDSRDLWSFSFFIFSLPIQTILDVQASIGALPLAKGRWFHQILESFPFYLKKKNQFRQSQ